MSIIWVVLILLIVWWVVRSFHTAAANLKAANQDYQSALKHWKAAYEKKPDQNKGIQFGYFLLRNGETEQAERIFNEVLAMEKLTEQNKFQVQLMLGLVEWKKGNLDGAISLYETMHEQGENTVIYANLGFLYLLKDAGDKTLSFLKKGYEYNDTNPAIIDNLAECYAKREEWDKSEELLDKAIKLPRPIAENYYHYGNILERKGELRTALSYYQKAVQMDLNALSGLNKDEIEQKIQNLEQSIEDEE